MQTVALPVEAVGESVEVALEFHLKAQNRACSCHRVSVQFALVQILQGGRMGEGEEEEIGARALVGQVEVDCRRAGWDSTALRLQGRGEVVVGETVGKALI